MIKASIISIGDELLIGQTVNTNVAYISTLLTEIGASVVCQSVVSDEEINIINELERVSDFSDLVITTGGLGPTHDDITVECLAKFLDLELIRDEDTYSKIEKLMNERQRIVTSEIAKMALIPESSTALENPVGVAPGILCKRKKTIFVVLPGVPREMAAISQLYLKDVVEELVANAKTIPIYRSIQTFGIVESQLASLIGDFKVFMPLASLAFLPSYKGVKLRIGVEVKSKEEGINLLDEYYNNLYSRIGKFVLEDGSKELRLVVADLLIKYNKTLACAESCTGGLFGATITEIPGSSAFFEGGVISYSNKMKMQLLGVNEATLTNFGAVSDETAKEMALGLSKLTGASYSISITGIAGPDGGSDEKPIGTVWVGIASENTIISKKFLFGKDRNANRERSVNAVFEMLYDLIKIELEI